MCPLCIIGHSNHRCTGDMHIGRDASEEDGTVAYYGKWFAVHNPYVIGPGDTVIDIQWEGCYVGYDGLKQATYDAGQATMAWAYETYGDLFGDNKPVLDEAKVREILVAMHNEMYRILDTKIVGE